MEVRFISQAYDGSCVFQIKLVDSHLPHPVVFEVTIYKGKVEDANTIDESVFEQVEQEE